MNDQLEKIQQTSESIINLGQSIANALLPVFASLVPSLQAVYDILWQKYLKAGMPYGETTEGMLRWIKELAGKDE